MNEYDIVKLDCIKEKYFGGCCTLFSAEGSILKTFTPHEPAMRYLFEMYQKYVEYVPDKALRERLGRLPNYMTIFSKINAYWYLCLTLNIMAIAPGNVYYPPEIWAEEFERHTYSREFLETLLKDLTECGKTEGALIVVKKLSELDSDGERFAL